MKVSDTPTKQELAALTAAVKALSRNIDSLSLAVKAKYQPDSITPEAWAALQLEKRAIWERAVQARAAGKSIGLLATVPPGTRIITF